MQIVLLGYMGSGKSTVGMQLAKNRNLDFIDLDDFIESGEGHSIAEIFELKGELYFRRKESEYLNQIVSKHDDIVLSTGGGTPCYGANMNTILKGTKNVFYLKCSLQELLNRLSKEKEHRPLIKDIADKELPEFLGKHLFERSFYYEKAPHTILCDAKNPATISTEIAERLV